MSQSLFHQFRWLSRYLRRFVTPREEERKEKGKISLLVYGRWKGRWIYASRVGTREGKKENPGCSLINTNNWHIWRRDSQVRREYYPSCLTSNRSQESSGDVELLHYLVFFLLISFSFFFLPSLEIRIIGYIKKGLRIMILTLYRFVSQNYWNFWNIRNKRNIVSFVHNPIMS